MRPILTKAVPLAFAAATLAACGGMGDRMGGALSPMAADQVRTLQPSGDGFAAHLAANYRDLAIYEADRMHDWQSANAFARKAQEAAAGTPPQPEPVVDGAWQVPDARQAELQQARQRLMTAFQDGARDRMPTVAATAQAKFDCWVEQASEDHQYHHISGCRDDFLLAAQAMEQPIQPVADVPPPVLVFFDWDDDQVRQDAMPIIDTLAQALRQNPQVPVIIEGHTDTSGATAYNQGLSERRAQSVASALAQRGVSSDRMQLVARGQNDLRVPTGDGTREPQNRRVRIEAGRPAMAELGS